MAETTINCPAAPDPCVVTITHVLDWNSGVGVLTQEQIEDYLLLWGAFLVAAVAVLCAKAVYNKFRIDHER